MIASRHRNILSVAIFVVIGLFMPDLKSVRRLSENEEKREMSRRLQPAEPPASVALTCAPGEEVYAVDWSLVTIDHTLAHQTVILPNGMDVAITISHTGDARMTQFSQTPAGYIKVVSQSIAGEGDLLDPAGGEYVPAFPLSYTTVEIDFLQEMDGVMVSIGDIDSNNLATDAVRVRMSDHADVHVALTTAASGSVKLVGDYAYEPIAETLIDDPGYDASMYAKYDGGVQRVKLDHSLFVFSADEVNKDPSPNRAVTPALDFRFCAGPPPADYVPPAPPAGVGVGVCLESSLILEETFPAGSTAEGWTNGKLEPSDGFSDIPGDQFLGRIAEGVPFPSKTFDVPTEAVRITLEFDFYEIDSWDGNSARWGQDYLNIFVNDENLDVGYFTFSVGENPRDGVTENGVEWMMQPYGPPARLAFNNFVDQKHKFTVEIPQRMYAESGKVTVRFEPHLSQTAKDESAGFDNIKLTAHFACEKRFNVCKGGCSGYTWGDPHIVTFDGRKFDCQGKGEFTLVKSLVSSLHIQGRFQKIPGTHPANDRVTYTTGIAMSYAFMPTTQLIIAQTTVPAPTVLGGCPVRLFVGGVEKNVMTGSGDERVEVNVIGSMVNIHYPDVGMSARIKIYSSQNRGCYFRQSKFYFSEDTCKKNAFVGLFGVPNNDVSDEWTDATGQAIAFGGRKGAAAYDYCVNTWCAKTPADSLFTYETGTDFTTFGFCPNSFTGDVETSPELAAICGTDEVCLTDGTIGGPQDGMAALEDQKEILEEKNAISSFRFDPAAVPAGGVSTDITITLDVAGLDGIHNIQHFALYNADPEAGSIIGAPLTFLVDDGSVVDDTANDDVFSAMQPISPVGPGQVFAFVAVPVIDGVEDPNSRLVATALNAVISYTDAVLGNPGSSGLSGGVNGDPLIMGIGQQIFKFEGQNGAWYSAVSTESFQWNMRVQEFENCPKDANRFVNGVAFTIFEKGMFRKAEHQILINVVNEYNIKTGCGTGDEHCLGGGSLELVIDGEKFLYPGDYCFRDERGRVVAFNTFYQCARKWYDFDVTSPNAESAGDRRLARNTNVFTLIKGLKDTMVDKEACDAWIAERKDKQDLFQQAGEWTTIIVKTESISFHIEYKQENKRCGAHSVDVWISSVSDELMKEQWEGVIGETRYFGKNGEKVERSEILKYPNDSAYEVNSPFSTKCEGCHKHS